MVFCFSHQLIEVCSVRTLTLALMSPLYTSCDSDGFCYFYTVHWTIQFLPPYEDGLFCPCPCKWYLHQFKNSADFAILNKVMTYTCSSMPLQVNAYYFTLIMPIDLVVFISFFKCRKKYPVKLYS